MKTVDVVIPFYNEEACLQIFWDRLSSKLSKLPKVSIRYVLVNDGSSDDTADLLEEISDRNSNVTLVHMLGNQGHQKALTAGLDHSTSDFVLMMDGDGQHPVEVAEQIILYAVKNEEYMVIQGVRMNRQKGLFKNISSNCFYGLVGLISPELQITRGASDFRVINRDALDLLKSYPDRHRNLRVLLGMLKLPSHHFPYNVEERLAGSSNYSLKKMLNLAFDGCFAFSTLPLKLSLMMMISCFSFATLYGGYAIFTYFNGKSVPGWASLVVVMLLMFATVFGVLAVMSEYIARTYEDARRHPIYRILPSKQKYKFK